MFSFRKKTGKILAGILICAVFMPSVFFLRPHRAEALFMGADLNAIKEYVLDVGSTVAMRILINRLALRTVAWMRGENFWPEGGAGSLLADVANQTTSAFIDELDLGFLCDPWEFGIKLAISVRKPYRVEMDCTLEKIKVNARKFSDNFGGGGWKGYITMTVDESSNPFSAYVKTRGELARRIADKQDDIRSDLTYGEGILSHKVQGTCLEKVGDVCAERAPDREITPGSQLSAQLKSATGLPYDQAVVAQEIDGAIGMIAGEFINQFITGGLSSIGPGGSASRSLNEAAVQQRERIAQLIRAAPKETIQAMEEPLTQAHASISSSLAFVVSSAESANAEENETVQTASSTLARAASSTAAVIGLLSEVQTTIENTTTSDLVDNTAEARANMSVHIADAKDDVKAARELTGELTLILNWQSSLNVPDETSVTDIPIAEVNQVTAYQTYQNNINSAEEALVETEENLVSLEEALEKADRGLEEGIQAVVRETDDNVNGIFGVVSEARNPAEAVVKFAESLVKGLGDLLTGLLPGGGGGGFNISI